jgi:hypothetical protein
MRVCANKMRRRIFETLKDGKIGQWKNYLMRTSIVNRKHNMKHT